MEALTSIAELAISGTLLSLAYRALNRRRWAHALIWALAFGAFGGLVIRSKLAW